ncbi:MAG: T9SS type A sorting domain-containing protein, partial [Bacteroidota bacterium]|nr:T9SS type A sorting domain-containing protein [Bacteroidota bacterium]
LFPLVTPDWPAQQPGLNEEASPWQWWDPNSAVAQAIVVQPDITAHMASMSSNPNMSPEKGRAIIDTIMGYLNPRILAALDLNSQCITIGLEEISMSDGITLYPNPSADRITVTSELAIIRNYTIYDTQGRMVQNGSVNAFQFTIHRNTLHAGSYFIQLFSRDGTVMKKFIIDR